MPFALVRRGVSPPQSSARPARVPMHAGCLALGLVLLAPLAPAQAPLPAGNPVDQRVERALEVSQLSLAPDDRSGTRLRVHRASSITAMKPRFRVPVQGPSPMIAGRRSTKLTS